MPNQRRSSHSSTIKPPPPRSPNVSPIENSLHLTPLHEIGSNIFTNTYPQHTPVGARGIYGGSVIAQSLLAAQNTVPPTFAIHSMHCYFVLAGNSALPILYHVEIVRQGRSFQTRSVQAKQHGRCIFIATCSFQIPVKKNGNGRREQDKNSSNGNGEEGAAGEEEVEQPLKRVVHHQPEMPADLPNPEDCENDLTVLERLEREGRIEAADAEVGRRRVANDPFEWRRIGVFPADKSVPPASKFTRLWVRSKAALADPMMNLPALAYFSDNWFIGTVGRHNPVARRGELGMQVSLDHTIYFHAGRETRVDDWLLVENAAPWAGDERGLVTQRIWDRDGRLVASCFQEGLVRLRDGREGEEGAVGSKL